MNCFPFLKLCYRFAWKMGDCKDNRLCLKRMAVIMAKTRCELRYWRFNIKWSSPFNDAMIRICRLFWIIFSVALGCFVAKVWNDCSRSLLQNNSYSGSIFYKMLLKIFSNFAVCHSSEFQRIPANCRFLQNYVSFCKRCKVMSRGCQSRMT